LLLLSVLSDQGMRDISALRIGQPSRRVAARVQREPLRPRAEESYAPPVPDTHEQAQIEHQRLLGAYQPATDPCFVPELDRVVSPAKNVAQRLIFKKHWLILLTWKDPDDPRVRGEPKPQVLIAFCREMQKTPNSERGRQRPAQR
jgi:hypothetical protein